MSHWNLFNRVLRLPPSQLYLGSLGVAVVLALASLAVGAGWISADISFEFSGGKTTKPRDIPLGYVQQLNFGPWNFLFCPVLLAAAGMAATLTDRLAPEGLKHSSFFRLGERPSLVVLSAVLLVASLAKNLLVELTTYQTRGLGWVQRNPCSKWACRASLRGSRATPSPSWLTTKGSLIARLRPRFCECNPITPASQLDGRWCS